MSWLADFYQRHPEYRHLRIAKRTHNSIHFEIEPGKYEAHFLTRPLFERVTSGLWLPIGNLAKAVRMGIALSRQPRLAWDLAKALPFVASPLTVQPDETSGNDTFIDTYVPTYNYGIATNLAAGTETVQTYQWRTLISFDISGLPVGATLTAGTLSLYCYATGDLNTYSVYAHRALTQWYEGDRNGAAPAAGHDGSTWNLRNANGAVAWAGGAGGGSGSDYAASPTATVSIPANSFQFYNWDVLADVQDWYDGVATNYGWWMLGVQAPGRTSRTFRSSGYATSGQRPKLVITYTEATLARSFAVIVG